MLELIQFPWSPYCIVQRHILEVAGVRFKVTNVPNGDRALVWSLTKQRYYGVPVIKDGSQVVFETDNDSQVIAKYLDDKFQLGLFPVELEGVQSILWRFIENEIEDVGFRLNDIYWKDLVPPGDRLLFLRHKERKFGHGCIEKWRQEKKSLLEELTRRLLPFDEMLVAQPFLLGARPHFVDFDLYGILGNFLYSGHYRLPASHKRLVQWHRRMNSLKPKDLTREKLRS